jgi:ABC-type branched-subunit amino acid transport system substrate-binding protein
MKHLRRLIAATVAGFALAASAGAAPEPIIIGASIALSPPGSVEQGSQIKAGLEIAEDLINAKGGVLGRPLKVLFQNDQGVPVEGRQAVEKLITESKAIAITGAHQSSVCLAELPVVHQHNIPFINTNCWSNAVREKGFQQVFNPTFYNTRSAEAVESLVSKLGVHSIVDFAENTDFGIGQAEALGKLLKEKHPDVKYKQVVLDRTNKDFTSAILPLTADKPDMIVLSMLAPAAYIVMNQLYQQGVAPSKTTWLFDASSDANNPDFWKNVRQAGQYLLSVDLYHPSMELSDYGKAMAANYEKKYHRAPNRYVFEAADSLITIADAIRSAKSTDADGMIHAMQTGSFAGTRGTIKFYEGKGPTYQQWLDIPFVVFQITQVDQPYKDTTLIEESGRPVNIDKLVKPH